MSAASAAPTQNIAVDPPPPPDAPRRSAAAITGGAVTGGEALGFAARVRCGALVRDMPTPNRPLSAAGCDAADWL